MNIIEELYKLKDDEYAAFQAKLTPSVSKDLFIGVRVPLVRNLSKQIKNTDEAKIFIETLPHKYYDENMLHGLLISELKDYDDIISHLDKFLPYVDNWAVCDIMSPKALKKKKDRLIVDIKRWVSSDLTYTIRFGIEMLMSFYLDDDFKEEYLNIPLHVNDDDYYTKMMQAWFYTTALTKQWDATIKIIENKSLDSWIHNKTIQKAIESYRISDDKKEYLRSLKCLKSE